MNDISLYDAFSKCLFAEQEYVHVEHHASYCVKKAGSTLTLLFQKSNGKEDWLNNFDFLPKISNSPFGTCCSALKAVPQKPYKDCQWKCHRGFLRVWKAIEPYIAADVRDPAIRQIRIIGYSHGAAVALLCHEYVRFHRPDVYVQGHGFGAPRVIWGRVPQTLRDRLNGFFVIRNAGDLVTHVPPRCVGFRDVGTLIELHTRKSNGRIQDHTPEAYMRALSPQENGAPFI